MALRFCDGMDNYSAVGDFQKKWASVPDTVLPTGGRYGGGAVTADYNIYLQSKPFTGGVGSDDFAMAFHFKATGKHTTTQDFLTCYNANNETTLSSLNECVGLRMTNTGICQLYWEWDYNSYSAGSVDICDGAWHWIEVRFQIANSGYAALYVDGALDVAYTGDTLRGTPTVNCDRFRFYNGGGYVHTFDDVIFYDSTTGTTPGELTPAANFPLGTQKIETLRPSGAGSTTGWTPSAGSNYACVDESVANGTDNVIATAADTLDTYAFGNLSDTPDSILAVVVSALTRNTEGGSKGLKLHAKSSSATQDGESKTLGPAYKTEQTSFAQDPNTSSAWTGSAVDAAEFGIKVA